MEIESLWMKTKQWLSSKYDAKNMFDQQREKNNACEMGDKARFKKCLES